MEEKKLNEAGYRSQWEYYDRLESTYRQMAEEMHQKKMEVLTEWKQLNRVKEWEDLWKFTLAITVTIG